MLSDYKTDPLVFHPGLVEPEVGVDDDHIAGVEVNLELGLAATSTLGWRLEEPSLHTGDLSLPGGQLQVVVQVEVGSVARAAYKYPHVSHRVQL